MGSTKGQTESRSEPWGPAAFQLERLYPQLLPYRTGSQTLQQYEALQPYQRRDIAGDLFGQSDMSQIGRMLGADPSMTRRALSLGFVPISPERRRAQFQGNRLLETMVDPALRGLSQTAQGDFLGSNPYLDEMYGAATAPMMEQFQTEILPALTGQMAGSGNLGSSGHEFFTQQAGKNLSRVLGETAAKIYGPAYESERERMVRASALMPTATMPRISMGMDLASMDERKLNDLLGMMSSATQFRSAEPMNRLQQLSQIYGGGAALGGSQSTPYYQNPLLQSAGLGLGAGGMAAMMGAGGPWSAAIGGGAALLPLLFGM